MAVTTAWPALGTVIALSTDGGTTYTPVGQVLSISKAGGGEIGERDTTNLGSVAKTAGPSLPDPGEVTFELNWDPTDLQHQQIMTWKNTPPTTVPPWKVTLPTSPVHTIGFAGWVKGLDGVNAGGVDENLTMSVTLRVVGAITIT